MFTIHITSYISAIATKAQINEPPINSEAIIKQTPMRRTHQAWLAEKSRQPVTSTDFWEPSLSLSVPISPREEQPGVCSASPKLFKVLYVNMAFDILSDVSTFPF